MTDRDPREIGLFRFFARQHVFTNLVTFGVLAVGSYLAFTMTKEAFPQIDFDVVIVNTPFRGAAPEEVEQLVTTPLERAVKGIDGIDQIESWSIEGASIIVIRLDPNHPRKDRTVKDIEREVDRVRNSELPEDGDEPSVQELTSERPVLNVDLSGAPERELREIANQLEDVLVEIEGVSKIGKIGYRKEQIWIEADNAKLSAQQLSLNDLITAVARSNHTSPGGRMIVGGKEVLVRTMGDLKTLKDVENVVVRSNAEGNHLLIRDVADVIETFEREKTFTRINGTKSLSLTVLKRPAGDALDIAAEVRRIVARFRERHPEVKFSFSDDVTFFIKRRLRVLINNGAQGIVLVLLCLFLFLSPVSAVFTTLAIPFAFLGGLIIIHMMGYTINLLSMFAFILVSGMLVDDGVVISEFYEQKCEEGLSPEQASVIGSSQMGLPITVAVLTTIVAFSPLAFVSGIMGKFLRQFPVVVVATLVVDLFECLFILPSHLALFARHLRFPPFIERMRAFGPWTMQRLQSLYLPRLIWCVSNPKKAFALFLLLLFGSLGLSKAFLRFHMFPVAVDEFFVSLEMPMGTSLKRTSAVAAEIEKTVSKIPPHEVESVISEIGITGDEHQRRRGTHYAQVRILLDRTGKRKRDGRVILEEIRRDLEAAAKTAGAVNLEIVQRRAGPPGGKAVEIRLVGDDYELLSRLAGRTKEHLSQREGVFGVKDDFTPGKEELRLKIDAAAAARAGLSPALVASVVRAAYDGAIATKIRRADKDEDIEVVVKLPEAARASPDTLKSLRITNPRGRRIPLSQLVREEKGVGFFAIPHANGKRAITVSADLSQKTTSSRIESAAVARFLDELLKDTPGVRYEFVGEEKERVEAVASLRKAMLVASLVIFTLLASLMGSFFLPIVVMSIIPFAFIGVFLTLLIHGLPLSMLVLIGLAGLMGVVVNNSILLVEAVGRLAKEQPGLGFHERLVEAGRQRLRPIVLTSVTTFFGVAPLGYGIGGREPFLEHVALTFGWGLIFTACITVFLVPTVYAVGYQISNWLRRRFGLAELGNGNSNPSDSGK